MIGSHGARKLPSGFVVWSCVVGFSYVVLREAAGGSRRLRAVDPTNWERLAGIPAIRTVILVVRVVGWCIHAAASSSVVGHLLSAAHIYGVTGRLTE